MQKRNGKGIILIFFCVIILAIFISYYFMQKRESKNDVDSVENNKIDVYTEDIKEDKNETKYKEYEFSTAYGEIKIVAEKAYSARGTAGASSIIFYLKDNKLYRYNNSGRDEIYADNVEDIYYTSDKDETLKVKLNKNSTISKETPYISYEK